MSTSRQHQQMLLASVGLILVLSSCNISTKTHTPFTLYWKDWAVSDATPPRTLNGSSTAGAILQLSFDPAHRFILETRPDIAVSGVRAYVTVNGVEVPMVPSGPPLRTSLFTYEPPDECHGSYSYSHRVTWRVPIWGGQSRRIPETGTYPVNVENYQHLLWYAGYYTHLSGSGALSFSPDHSTSTATFKNLLGPGTQRRVESVDLDPAKSDSPKFQIVSTPALPVVLNCGDEIPIQVKWNAPPGPYNAGNDYDDESMVRIQYASLADGVHWIPNQTRFLIPLKTEPQAH